MESNIILTKESSSEEIKNYFQAILKLSQADNKFPIKLDEVWPLVYSEKSKAVRALVENFIQDIDYQILAQNGKNSAQVGRPSNVYYLSLPCLEYFIARKVRPVFEVYRQVFHGVVQGKLPKSVKTTDVNGLTIEDKVEFISICKDAGFMAWEVAALVGDLLDTTTTMTELREVITLVANRQLLETRVLQIVVSLYSRSKGLPSTQSSPRVPLPVQSEEPQSAPIDRQSRLCVRSMKDLLEEKQYKGVYASEVMETLCRYGYIRKVQFGANSRWEWTLTIEGEVFGCNTAMRGGMAVRPKWFPSNFETMMRTLGYTKKEGKEVVL